MNNNNQINAKGCIIVLVLFLAGFCFMYFVFQDSGEDCIRFTGIGTVECECEYPDHDAWQEHKEATHGSWEAVIVKEDYPCK